MRHAVGCLATWFLLAAFPTPGAADDFRIETKVYSGRSKAPVSQNVTLFQSGYVYDYLADPVRVAVFDQAHGRFILLDPVRKLRAEVKTDDVLTFTGKLHDLAARNPNSFMKFAADPDFQTNFSQDGQLALTSRHITYELMTEPANSERAARQYRDFSDWYARFNAMINPGSTPPFPRMIVNKELAERGLVPTEVRLTIGGQTLDSRGSMHTEHHVSWRLLPRDLEKIAETANQLVTFQSVELSELQPVATAKR